MSQLDNTKESAHLLGEIMETCEGNTLLTSKSSKSEDVTKTHPLNSSTNLSDSPNSVDDAASTSGAVDPSNQDTLVELSDARLEGILKSSKHLSDSCHRAINFDSIASTSEAVDPINQDTLDEHASHPSLEAIRYQDVSKSIHGGFDSEASGAGEGYTVYTCRAPTTFYGRYSMRMRIYRHFGYLLPFEIICLAFTISCCFLGAYNWEMCRANVVIPRYLFCNGALATFSLCLHIIDTIWKRVWNNYHFRIFCCAFGMGWIALITTIIEMIEFYSMSYSFHKNEENYCRESLYWFVYYKNIALAVLMPLTAIIYIPTFEYNGYELIHD